MFDMRSERMGAYMRILLAEDERELSRALVAILEHAGYVVDAAMDGEEALYDLDINDYDLAILDIMMPKVDGLTVLTTLRGKGMTLPVLMLTAKSEIRDRVAGLDAGANDSLTKPFAAQELLARIRVLTRTTAGVAKRELAFGDISLDEQASQLVCGETRVDLTAREFQMMEMLVTAKNTKISTDAFMRKVWGSLSDVETSVVWVNLSNLRKKLAQAGSSVRISALRGVGYYLEENDG